MRPGVKFIEILAALIMTWVGTEKVGAKDTRKKIWGRIVETSVFWLPVSKQ